MNALENLTPPEESTLKEEILLSLFTNQRAEEGGKQAFGWWAECLEDQMHFGSKLWLLEREKLTPETLEKATLYAKEALSWIVDENRAEEIHVSGEFVPHGILLSIDLSSLHHPHNMIRFRCNYVLPSPQPS